MNRRWWKAYFFLVLVVTVVALAVPLFIDESPGIAWWEWVYLPLYIVQLVGLFGFAYWRRFAIPPLWQVVFLASVAYAVWDLYSMATDPEVTGDYSGLVIWSIFGTLFLQVPMLVGLFLYGFRCRDLWRGAT